MPSKQCSEALLMSLARPLDYHVAPVCDLCILVLCELIKYGLLIVMALYKVIKKVTLV